MMDEKRKKTKALFSIIISFQITELFVLQRVKVSIIFKVKVSIISYHYLISDN